MGIMNRIVKTISSRTVEYFIRNRQNGTIIIPHHQREYCWNMNASETSPYCPTPREIQFIQSLLNGYPIPSILLSRSDEPGKLSLEDGRQRITCALRYTQNLFGVKWRGEERTFDQLTAEEQFRLLNEQIPTVEYENATMSDKIAIFDRHQNGAPLTSGERYNAHETELVQFTKEMFMTPGQGFHDDAIPYWGDQTRTDKRCKRLLTKIGFMIGLRHGPADMNTKYEPHRDFLTTKYPASIREKIKRDIRRILDIYAAVEELYPLEPRKRNKWNKIYDDPGNFTGYILYSLSIHEDMWSDIKPTWVDYIVGVRHAVEGNSPKKITSVLDQCIHKDMPKTRSWNLERWKIGYCHVFAKEYDGFSEYDTVQSSDDE
jgi:hypothetical protein